MGKAAHIQKVYVTATNAAAVAADRIDGLDSASFSETIDMVDANYIGGSGFKGRIATLKDTSGDVSGHYLSANAPQNLVRSSGPGGASAGATVYVTFIFDDAAAAGSKGKRVPMLVESYDEQLATGDVVKWSAKFVGNGEPVAV